MKKIRSVTQLRKEMIALLDRLDENIFDNDQRAYDTFTLCAQLNAGQKILVEKMLCKKRQGLIDGPVIC